MLRNRKARIGCFIAFFLFLSSSQLFAVDRDPLSEEIELPNLQNDSMLSDTSIWGSYIQMFIVLIIIIVMILLFVKFLSNRNKLWLSNRAIQTLGGVSLGQNKSLQLVEIGRSVYLIGIGDNVQLLEKISDPEEVQQIMENLDRQTESGDSLLKNLLNRRKQTHHEDVTEPTQNFQQLFQDKLQRVSGQSQKIERLLQESKDEKDGRRL